MTTTKINAKSQGLCVKQVFLIESDSTACGSGALSVAFRPVIEAIIGFHAGPDKDRDACQRHLRRQHTRGASRG